MESNDDIVEAGISAEIRENQGMQGRPNTTAWADATETGEENGEPFPGLPNHQGTQGHWHKGMDPNIKNYPLNNSQKSRGTKTTVDSYAGAIELEMLAILYFLEK